MLNRLGVGDMRCPNYPERPCFVPQVACREGPRGPACWGGAVTSSSFLLASQGWPHHPPVFKPEPRVLSRTPLFLSPQPHWASNTTHYSEGVS